MDLAVLLVFVFFFGGEVVLLLGFGVWWGLVSELGLVGCALATRLGRAF